MTALLEEALSIWHDSPETLPEIGRVFCSSEQAEREAGLDRFLAAIEREARRVPATRSERGAAWERINSAFEDFGATTLQLGQDHLDLLLRGGLSAIGSQLARQARRFDPSVTTGDILQASRNAWTACGLQMLLGRELRLTPSIFAYSMLYPYTDNYLDAPAISREEKGGFGVRFGCRLEGEPCQPANPREAAIWALVALIESEYSRERHPAVFASLLAIHRAQQASVRLLRRGAGNGRVDVAALCFEKGGASVLADAYLAAGSLTREQARFAYLWGVLLQLGDDLQDVRQDTADGVLTVFTCEARERPLDSVTCRALWFASRILPLMRHLPAVARPALRQLIERSTVSLLIRSAGAGGSLYTPAFLGRIEAHSPFRFAYLEGRQARLARQGGMIAKLFEAFLAGDEDEPAFPLLPGALMPRC